MISTPEIQSVVQKLQKQKEDSEFVKSKKKEGFLSRKLEKEVISSKYIENILPEDMNLFYNRINSSRITEYTEYNNYDTGLMDVALSGSSKIYLSTFPGSLENNERILEWIRNVRYLVSTLPNPTELATSITKLRQDYYGADTFSIKAPRLEPDEEGSISSERLDCLVHEAFVGLFGLNPLRRKGIPNFVYVYGAFESSPPIIDSENRKIFAWGNKITTKDQILYSILENTNSIETLTESCKNDSYDVVLSYFLQVVLALKAANDYCGFTHYNLHTKNVLIRKMMGQSSSLPFDIEYNLNENKKVYIRSPRGNIATIQEFSTSYIYVNVDKKSQGFGYNNYDELPFEDKGIYNNKSFVIGDVYRLLLTILAITYTENKTVYTQLKPLFSFFSSEALESVMEKQKETFYNLPIFEKTESLRIEDFITFALKKFEASGIIHYKDSPIPVLRTSGTCFERDSFFLEVSKKTDAYCIPRTTIQLYDYIKYFAALYSETKNPKYIQQINRTAEFFEKEFTESINDMERTRLESITDTLNSRFILHELSYNNTILKKESFRNMYKDYISKCILYMNTWERMKTGIKILEFIEKGGSMFKTLYTSYVEIQNKNKGFYEAVRLNLLKFYTWFSCNLQNEHYGTILQGVTKERHYEMIKEAKKDPIFDDYFLLASFVKSIWN
jgi:hypothetical protein